MHDERGQLATAGKALGAFVALTTLALAVPGTGFDDHDPMPAAGASSEAERIVRQGVLESYGVDAAGRLLTVWGVCPGDTRCVFAWRLSDGARVLGAGVVPDIGDAPGVQPVGDGYLLQAHTSQEGLLVSSDGTARTVDLDCAARTWPTSRDPGRWALTVGVLGPTLVDLWSATSCDASEWGPRTMSAGAVSDDDTVWAVVGSAPGDRDGHPAVARWDGRRWTYRDLTTSPPTSENLMAVDGESVAVLQGDGKGGAGRLTITSDGGRTWSDVDDLPFTAPRSLAFAGPSTLVVSDFPGTLWLSTDLVTFTRVKASTRLNDLVPAGGAVIAQVGFAGSSDDLVRVTADGDVEPLVAR